MPDPVGPVAVDLSPTVVAFVSLGCCLGIASGLVPGLHANNFALVLAAAAPVVPGPPLAVGAAMLAAGVVHTFLDVVPTLAFGVPDAAMVATALPGHRLVLAGEGPEAVRLSALGSGVAVVLAVPLVWPLTSLLAANYATLEAFLPVLMAVIVLALVATEPTLPRAAVGLGVVGLSGALGHATLSLSVDGPLASNVLTPLFAGLFGAPVLLDAIAGTGPPRQDRSAITVPRRLVAVTAAAGTVAGALVGYLPGVSSGVAAVLVLAVLPGSIGDRGYVVATSGVNTANTIFATAALVVLERPRTGVLVAVQSVGAPPSVPVLGGAIAVAAAVGFLGVLLVGEPYLRVVGRAHYGAISAGVLALLATLSWLFAGGIGLAIFALSTLVGLVPVRWGVKRVHLMGVLIVPLGLG